MHACVPNASFFKSTTITSVMIQLVKSRRFIAIRNFYNTIQCINDVTHSRNRDALEKSLDYVDVARSPCASHLDFYTCYASCCNILIVTFQMTSKL